MSSLCGHSSLSRPCYTLSCTVSPCATLNALIIIVSGVWVINLCNILSINATIAVITHNVAKDCLISETPLTLSIWDLCSGSGNLSLIYLLLTKGASPKLANQNGLLPVQVAIVAQNMEAIEVRRFLSIIQFNDKSEQPKRQSSEKKKEFTEKY